MLTRSAFPFAGIAVVLLQCGCMHRTDTKKLVNFVTFNVGLPAGAIIVDTKQDSGWEQDAHWYLIFDASEEEIAEFAAAYSDGVTIDNFLKSRFEIHGAGASGTWMDNVAEMPWDLTTIKSGRYFRRKDTSGFLAIDMANNRVYIFR